MAVPFVRGTTGGDRSLLGLPGANYRVWNVPTSASRRRGADQLLRNR
jgi:hypothetical protein